MAVMNKSAVKIPTDAIFVEDPNNLQRGAGSASNTSRVMVAGKVEANSPNDKLNAPLLADDVNS